MIAKNHQYLGVNRAIAAVQQIGENRGRLGVFWHTQGSGKSLSMMFFAQKVLRKLPGNWTFLVVTDRAGARRADLPEPSPHRGADRAARTAQVGSSGEHLQQLLPGKTTATSSP